MPSDPVFSSLSYRIMIYSTRHIRTNTASTYILFCRPRVEVTSCFVDKIMGLAFREKINTQLIYRFELAQALARRITKPQRYFLGSNLTGSSFLFSFFILRGGGGLINYSLHVLFFPFYLFLLLFFYYFLSL